MGRARGSQSDQGGEVGLESNSLPEHRRLRVVGAGIQKEQGLEVVREGNASQPCGFCSRLSCPGEFVIMQISGLLQ